MSYDSCHSLPAGSTYIALTEEEVLKLDDLLYGMMVASANDAANGVAECIGGTAEQFVQMMNDKCTELGLLSTHMTNATGLHNANHYTTCREMASLLAAAVANEQVKTLLSSEKHVTTTNVHGKVTFYSTYFADLKNAVSPFAYVSSNATDIAAKTGMTDEAGYCLATYMKSKATGKRESIDDIIIVAINTTEGVLIRLTGRNIELEDATSLLNI